jgi:hypothetical protein
LPRDADGSRRAVDATSQRFPRRRAAATTIANTAPSAASGPPGAGAGEAAHDTFVVVVPCPEQVSPVHDPLPVAVVDTSIFTLRIALSASTQSVTLVPTST